MKRPTWLWVLAAAFLIPQFAIRNPQLQAAEALQEIVVRSGDTLWGIANHYLKDPKKWPDLLKYNSQLGDNPTVALPGMKLRVPVLLIKEQLRAAELVYLLRDVRYRRKDSNEWRQAKLNMELTNEDSLRTMAESMARIRFPAGEIVNLNENSLVLIRPEKGGDVIQLMAGDVKARQSRVITAGGVRVDPLGPDTEYRTRVRLDKSELVLVYRGRVDVTAQGKTVRVPEGFGSEIKPLMPPAEPVPLPKIPLVYDKAAPAPPGNELQVRAMSSDRELVLSVDIPQIKDLAVQKSAAPSGPPEAKSVPRRQILDKYHLQVDANAEFQNPLADQYAPLSQKLDLLKLGLPNGSYFWRIAFVDSLGMEGAFSPAQSFNIDLEPPTLTVSVPHEGQETAWEEEFLQVLGQTESGASVSVDDKAVDVDAEGRFSPRVYLREGKNRLLILARDASGNESKLERVVYRLLPGQKGKFLTQRKKEGAEEKPPTRESRLAAFSLGLLTIGTIVGVVLLIIG